MNPAIYYLSSLEAFPDYVPTPIQIGDQIWDQKNLNTVRYSDGTPLTRSNNFAGSTVGEWRYYNNDSANATVYGKLYNWYAAVGIWNAASLSNPALRKDIAPTGWRVATEADWAELSTYLLGDIVSGGKLKESGLSHWALPNLGATNTSLFTALPGGTKSGSTGAFSNITLDGYWWVYNSTTPIGRFLDYNSAALGLNTAPGATSGRSIRLIKILPPVVLTTTAISNINYTTADTGGNITDDGGNAVTARGVCWSVYINPTVALATKTSDGTGTGTFTSNLTELVSGTYYYVRAYATNSLGTTYYGDNIRFQTLTTAYTPILDANPAYHAYSLRKLRTAYTGACIKVRRTTTSPVTSTTADVAFDNNGAVSFSSLLSNKVGTSSAATTLGEFAAGTVDGLTAQSIYVSTWYDQSGNNKNIVAPSNAASPLIATIGVLETGSNGKVATRYSGAQYLNLTDASTPYTNSSFYILGAGSTNQNINFYGLGYQNNNSRLFMGRNGGIFYNNASTTTPDWTTPFTANVLRLYELVAGTSTASAWSNGIQLTTPNTTKPAMAVNNIYIRVGTNSEPGIYTNGSIQEVIAVIGTSNRTTIETNINTYWTIY